MSGKAPFLSLIIPVYNETTRLSAGLETIRIYLSKQPYSWEVILVDDGSEFPIGPFKKSSGIRVVRLSTNSGKGAAIKKGVTEANGHIIVFCDIDMSVPIETLTLMRKKLKQFPVVITSRRLTDSRIVVHQPLFREISGRIFTTLSNVLCKTKVADVTCGFKGFTREAAKDLFSQSRINRWVFDTEIIFLARKHNYEIRQIAVDWTNKPGSKVRAFDSMQSLSDLFRIRLNDIRGRYEMRSV